MSFRFAEAFARSKNLFSASTTSAAPVTTIIRSIEGVRSLVNKIIRLPASPPSLYIDVEGINIGRHGTVSIVQIFAPQLKEIFLVDIHILGGLAFTTGGKGSLKSIFESDSIPKVIFDIRHDSDALHYHYDIKMAGIHDLQLMEYGSRTASSTKYLNGLARCVRCDAPMTVSQKLAWKKTKEEGMKAFAPQHGGSHEVFNIRPMRPEIIEYCAQDVQVLPMLWQLYNSKLNQISREVIQAATLARIRDSQSPHYISDGPHMTLRPW